jgi:hypothetical protein
VEPGKGATDEEAAAVRRARRYRRLAKRVRHDPRLWLHAASADFHALWLELSGPAGTKLDRVEAEARIRARTSGAEEALARAHRLSPSPAVHGEAGWAWLNVATALSPPSLPFLRKAREAFFEATARDPGCPLHWVGLGETHRILEERKRAGEAFRKALNLTETGGPRLRMPSDLERWVRARASSAERGGAAPGP